MAGQEAASSVRRRVESEAWDTVGGSRPVIELRTKLVDLICDGDSKTPTQANALTRDAINILRRLDANARAAVGRAQVAKLSDEPELRASIAGSLAEAAKTKEDIDRLELEFAAEKKAAERRVTYDSMAKVILKKESRAASEAKLAEMEVKIAEYEEEGRKLRDRKAGLKNIFQLVEQSYCDLAVSAEMEISRGASVDDHHHQHGAEPGEVETGEVRESGEGLARMTDV